MDVTKGFDIQPAANGGVIIHGKNLSVAPFGADNSEVAAFTTPADMITWLAKQYGLTASVVVPGGYLVTENLCEDEGCPNHGTPHECVNWTVWSGFSMLECDKGRPCMIRMRDGTERAGKLWDNPRRWHWAINDAMTSRDIIAYRLV